MSATDRYIKKIDPLTQSVSYELEPKRKPVIQPVISNLKSFASARLGETSTYLGGAILAVGSPVIAQQLVETITMFGAHDYTGAIIHGAIVAGGIGAAVKGIVTPDKPPDSQK
jgi:hypothetical protein